MGTEIEQKFLVESEAWREHVEVSVPIVQGYLRSADVAVRVRTQGEKAKLTFKAREPGTTRGEWEYEIPIEDAQDLIEQFCGDRVVRKVRHHVPSGGKMWEVDEFSGRHQGLVIAELELDSETEAYDAPDWLGREVTHDKSYYNEALATWQ